MKLDSWVNRALAPFDLRLVRRDAASAPAPHAPVLAQAGVAAVAEAPAPAPPPSRPEEARGLEHFAWLLGREPQPEDFGLSVGRSEGVRADDEGLVARVMTAYRRAWDEFRPSGSFWDDAFFQLKRPMHEAFVGDDVAAAASLLRRPSETTHFWGFDAIAKAPPGEVEPHELVVTRLNRGVPWTRLYGLWVLDALKNLAEAVGAKRVAYPEVDVARQPIEIRQGAEETLDAIDAALGVRLEFPNPYAEELGLATSRGIVGFRAVQAVYQAWRIRELSGGRPGFTVLEIGAGLGRTAFFAHRLGLTNYTILDIPMTNAAQGYFLGRTLGGSSVQLHGEPGGAPVRVLATTSPARDERYDLVVNVDSLTEMADDVARGYWATIRRNAGAMLSINHEYNALTVRSLYQGDLDVHATRHPYWMRRGYVEEMLTFGRRGY